MHATRCLCRAVEPSIAIIGAGIGGLACANALLHKSPNRPIRIYEQADRFLPTAGAGFGFSPNGQICLSSINLAYSDFMHPFDKMVRLDKEGKIKHESFVLRELRERNGFGLAGCLRADLVDRLVQQPAVKENLHYSHKLVQLNPLQDKVELEFANGTHDLVDLVIGADGIHSTVARLLDIDDSPPVYSNANIFYGVIPNPDSHIFEHDIFRQDYHRAVMNGPGTGEFITFRVGPDDRKHCIWACTYTSKSPPAQRDEWDRGHVNELQSLLLTHYPARHPIHELAAATPSHQILHFGLFYRAHKTRWFRDRVVLLGDSCHATLPYVGQGANQAIEDAVVLAHCLTSNVGDHKQSFQQYYDKRFTRTKRVVQLAGILDKLYHSKNPLVQWFLDLLLSQLIKGGFILKQIEKEIVEFCPVKDFAKYRPK